MDTSTCAPFTVPSAPVPTLFKSVQRPNMSGVTAKQAEMLESLRNASTGEPGPVSAPKNFTVMSSQPSCAALSTSSSMPMCGPPCCTATVLPLSSVTRLMPSRATMWSPADQVICRITTPLVRGSEPITSDACPIMRKVPRRNGVLPAR